MSKGKQDQKAYFCEVPVPQTSPTFPCSPGVVARLGGDSNELCEYFISSKYDQRNAIDRCARARLCRSHAPATRPPHTRHTHPPHTPATHTRHTHPPHTPATHTRHTHPPHTPATHTRHTHPHCMV
eukprot:3265395-Prymnesium_polylepis.1